MSGKIGVAKERFQAGPGAGSLGMKPSGTIQAKTSAQGTAASNAAGKTPFGRVIQVPNNTVKGYAEGGEVQPQNTSWLGTPSYEDILSQQSPAIQLANQDPYLAAEVAPGNALAGIGKGIGNIVNAAQQGQADKAAQFGFSMPGAEQAGAAPTPVSNVDLGVQEAVAEEPQVAQATPGASGMERYKQGVYAEANAQAQAGEAKALIAQQEQARIQEIENDYQTNYQALEAERNAVMEDLKASHIDPNRFIGQMGGGARVSTAIGLMLSGFGSGMSGQPNMAMNFLQKQIDNDIYAQTQELGKKNNLLTATMAQFGNLKDATQMARVITQDLYKAKIEEAAAKSMDPMAKARAQQVIGEMELKQAPALMELARKQTVMNGMKTGKVKPAEAVTVLVPEANRAKALEEVGKIETVGNAVSDIQKAMDEMAAINTLEGRVSSPLQTSRKVQALQTSVMGALKPIFGALSESDKVEAMSNIPKVGDNSETIRTKVNNLTRLARDAGGATPTLDAYGVTIDKSRLQERRKTLDNKMFQTPKGK
jgi:hypothetical protein